MKVDKENIVHGFCYVFGIPIITYNHVFVLCLRKKRQIGIKLPLSLCIPILRRLHFFKDSVDYIHIVLFRVFSL